MRNNIQVSQTKPNLDRKVDVRIRNPATRKPRKGKSYPCPGRNVIVLGKRVGTWLTKVDLNTRNERRITAETG